MTLATFAVVVYAFLGLLAAVMITRARRAVLPGTVLPEAGLPMVSIIVAARNEEDALPDCLDALAAQSYPADRIEFLIVDDESTDRTADSVESRSSDARFRLIQVEELPGHPPGKTAALHSGMEQAQGEIILFTDADCRPPVGWARSLAGKLAALPSLVMLAGVTHITGRGLWARLQSADWALLKGVASGLSATGFTPTVMGNNMAIRRSAYEEVGGYPSVPASVTEDFALSRRLAGIGGIALDAHPSLSNLTLPVESLTAFFRQRRRWARGALAASPAAFAFYAVVLAAHVLPLLLVFTAGTALVPLFVAKVLTDAAVILAATPTGERWKSVAVLPLYEILLYAYVLTLPLSLAVAPDITWKDRRHAEASSSRAGTGE